MRETFAKQDAALEGVRKAVTEGLQSIHEALTPEQRRQLGDLIELGPRGGHGRGRGFAGRCAEGGAVHL